MTTNRFVSEEDYSKLLESKNFQCLVRLKIFKGELQTDLDRSVIISIDSTEKNQIEKCLKDICSVNFTWAKSFHRETIINEDIKLDQ